MDPSREKRVEFVPRYWRRWSPLTTEEIQELIYGYPSWRVINEKRYNRKVWIEPNSIRRIRYNLREMIDNAGEWVVQTRAIYEDIPPVIADNDVDLILNGGVCSPLGLVLMDWLEPLQAIAVCENWTRRGINPEDVMELVGFIGASTYPTH